jgi:hypothetical protein
MVFERKDFESLDERDLESLITGKVQEGRDLDYKRDLPGDTSGEKREFLKDVSSFANAAGGFLIFGVKEESGEPKEIVGVSDIDADSTKLRLEQIIQSGIEPRIPGVRTLPIKLKDGKAVFVIHIPRSWALPHRVSFEGHNRFWSRNSGGKYELDVSELRALFVLSETSGDRIRAFRRDRIIEITTGETAVQFLYPMRTILHLVPFSAFDPGFRIDLGTIHRSTPSLALINPVPLNSWANPIYSQRFNFDGIKYLALEPQSKKVVGYTQLFRSGIVESVDGSLADPPGQLAFRTIRGEEYESRIWNTLAWYLQLLRRLGVPSPFLCMLSLLGVRGYGVKPWSAEMRSSPIDRDVLLIPEIMIEGYDCDAAEVMKPAFDVIWNASGLPGSENYDEHGKWKRSR